MRVLEDTLLLFSPCCSHYVVHRCNTSGMVTLWIRIRTLTSFMTIIRLQLVENSAARLVSLNRKQENITPILTGLHWLPVHFRIIFKISLLTYKALNWLVPSFNRDLLRSRDYEVRERIPHTCPSSYEIFFQSIFVCVVILLSTSYWSVRVTSFNFKLNGGL